MKLKSHLLTALALAAGIGVNAATNELVVQTNKIGAPVQPTMYGIFFEDINYAADGGLYAEMIKNRSFEFPQNFMGWVTFGNVDLKDDGPFERNPHYVRLGDPGHGHKHTGLENEGFFGVSVKKGEKYRFSVWARTPDGAKSSFRVEIVDTKSMGETQVIAKEDITVDSKEWKKYQVILTPSETLKATKTACVKTLHSTLPTFSPECSASPADASWKVLTSTPAINGRTP